MKVVFHAVYHEFTKTEVEAMAQQVAKLQIVGPMLHGSIGEQKVRWMPDGGLEVISHVTRETPPLPPAVPRPRRRRRS